MDNELFELCKEVYEATGQMWDGTEKCYAYIDEFNSGEKHWRIIPLHEDNVDDVDDWHPLYTSDYLLEKLPKIINVGYWLVIEVESITKDSTKYNVRYKNGINNHLYGGVADTPLKALLKLTLALKEAGEL